MKKLLIPIVLFALCACGNRTETADPNFVDIKPFSYADSVFLENDYSEGYATYSIEMELPVTDNKALHDNILNWMLRASNQAPADYAKSEKNRFFKEDGNEPLSELISSYTLLEQTDLYVTYLTDGYLYTGGAHGMPWLSGKTFRKSDGQPVGYDIFDHPEQLKEIVLENLCTQYFGDSGTDVYEALIEWNEEFVLPSADPWVENDSIVFCYGSYEIAPFSEGLPFCKISKDDIMPYLNEKGKSLFGTK